MATGWPIEARIALLHECWLAAGHAKSVQEADGPHKDWFYLTQAILDDTTYGCTTRQRLISQLKKTAVWPKVLPFLRNRDGKCAVCKHSEWRHGGVSKASLPGGECSYQSYNYSGHVTTLGEKCKCKKFVRKPMK